MFLQSVPFISIPGCRAIVPTFRHVHRNEKQRPLPLSTVLASQVQAALVKLSYLACDAAAVCLFIRFSSPLGLIPNSMGAVGTQNQSEYWNTCW